LFGNIRVGDFPSSLNSAGEFISFLFSSLLSGGIIFTSGSFLNFSLSLTSELKLFELPESDICFLDAEVDFSAVAGDETIGGRNNGSFY
jgi:hypothetical protein